MSVGLILTQEYLTFQ